jgi:peptidoglycan/xylan/chitin deacetylase (PgdA/CDA1 family)
MTAEAKGGPLERAEVPGAYGYALSVDLEEWYHTCWERDYVEPWRRPSLIQEVPRLVPRFLDDLAAVGARATFFVLGEIAAAHPRAIRAIAEAGHEIASHNWLHQRADWISAREFREQAVRSKRFLEDLTGMPVRGFRAPEWSLRSPAHPGLEALAAAGYLYDSSLTRAWGAGRAANPRLPEELRWPNGRSLIEIPPLMLSPRWRYPASGWTARLAPHSWLLAAADQLRATAGAPVLVVHLWELEDRDLPGVLAGASRWFHDAARRGYREKFLASLAARPWDSIGHAAAGLLGANVGSPPVGPR